jgi:autotransporter-associated beta strand protein
MHPSSHTRWCHRVVGFIAACCSLFASARSFAVDYTWGSATTGGSWSVTTNWSPNGAPTSADTALLGDATANRTVFYNAAASGTLTGLSFTQTTTGVLNELQVQRAIRVTNAVTLGASSGTARLLLLGTAASITGTFSGGINVNSGGVLSLGLYNPSGTSTVYVPSLSGNVAVGGGLFELAAGTLLGTGLATGNHTITGSLTMTSGTLFIDNSASRDRRLTVGGNLSVTGGSVLSNSGNVANNLILNGAVNTFAPQAFDAAKIQISLQASGNQTFSGSTVLGTLTPRGTGIKTLSNTGTISSLQFIDGSSSLGSRTTLNLASNVAAANAPFGAAFSQSADSAGNVEFGIDADAYTLDFSSAGVWTPTKFAATGMTGQVGTISNTVWALSGTAGRIRASGYNFATSGTTTLTTTVGPGLVLEATGATATNVLSGSGAIDPTSTFRFTGTSTVPGTPATLSSDRAIGNLEVTSGALRLGATFTSMQHVRVSGGSLDLLSKSLTVPSVQLTGGTITTGTLTSSGPFDVQAGSLAAALLGTGTLTKSGPGLVVLSGANEYTGGTTIDSGTLQIGAGVAAGSITGDVAVNGGVLAFNRSDAITFGGGITGAGGIAVLGSGTTTLTGANDFSGGTTLSGGVLGLGSANAIGSTGTIDFAGGTLQSSAANTTDYSARFSTAAGQQYSLATNGQSVSLGTALASDGGSLTKNGLGTLTLLQDATFAGTTTVNNGTLALGDGGSAGSVAGPIALANAASVVVNRSNDLTLGGVISGAGSLTKQGVGTLTLTAANTFVGTTTISAGTISLSGGNNRLATGGTVSFSGNAGLSVSGSQTLHRVTLADNVSAALAGSGSVTVTGATFFVGGTGTNTSQTLDASGLTSLTSSNAAGTFKVGGNNMNGVATGRLMLPANAAITASSIGIGADSNNIAVSSGTLTLGTTTTISANTITLGSSQSQGTIDYAAGTTNPVLTIRAANGTSPVANMTIGTSGGYGLATTSRIDLSGGVTGASTLDALVTDLVIGQSTRPTSLSGGSLNITGGLLMQTGTLTATTITLGQTLNNPTITAAGQQITGSLSLSGGTVNVGTLSLADQNWTGATVAGIFRLDGGGTLNAGTIASGTGAGSGAAVRTFQWNNGTIANRDAGTDLTIGSGIAFTLASTGTHRFSIGAGRSGSVASVLAGAGGTLEKTGDGTLTLSANNTYTGATAIAAGTLFVNGDQSAAVGAVTVDLGATLAGSGTIGGAVSILGGGIVAPGTLTVANSFSLADASILSFELAAQNTTIGGGINDLITGVTDLTLDGILNISGTGDWTAVADNTAWRLFNYSGTLVDNGLTLGSMPTLSAGQSFQIDTATAGQVNIVVVPEPAALALAGLGIAAAAILRCRRK